MDAPRTSEHHEGRFGRYRFITELGHGGMASVHLAVMHGLAGMNKLVAIKRISPQFLDDPEYLGMFLDEARLTARFCHPNVVQSYEIGEEAGRYFMAMEYLEGQTLQSILQQRKTRGGLPLSMHLRILSDALAGLDYVHNLADFDGTPLGIVHRDVTPHNIFVTYEGGVKLVDFGIAKARGVLSQAPGVLRGKLGYMAPEQTAQREIDRRADIFAVGVMLWEAATGLRLREVTSDINVASIRDESIPRPTKVNPDVPARLEALIVKALSRDPADRYATAAALGADLDAYLDDSGDRARARDLGKLLAKQFARERACMRTCIRWHLSIEVEDDALSSSERETSPEVVSQRKPCATPVIWDTGASTLDANARPTPASAHTETRRSEVSSTAPSAVVPRVPVSRRKVLGWAAAAALMGGALLGPLWFSRPAPAPPRAESRVEVPTPAASALGGDPVMASNPAKRWLP